MANLDYQNPIIIERLANAHNPAICPIRTDYIEQENEYFRRNIKDSRVILAGSGLGLEAKVLSENNSYVLCIENNPVLVNISQAYIQEPNVKFSLGDFTNLPLDNKSYNHVVLNFGTIGNFNEFEQHRIIKELTRVAGIVHMDFYTSENNDNRLKMYTQEGWRNVRLEKKAFTSDEGAYSKIFTTKKEFDMLVMESIHNCTIDHHKMPGFGYMARIRKTGKEK